MAGDVDRIQPLQRGHARARRAPHGEADLVDARPLARHEVQRGVAGARGLRQRAHVTHRLAERLGVQRYHLGAGGHRLGDPLDVLDAHGADRAQRLGDDQVGLELAQPLLVEGIDRLAALGALRDGGVDLPRRQPRGQHVAGHGR